MGFPSITVVLPWWLLGDRLAAVYTASRPETIHLSCGWQESSAGGVVWANRDHKNHTVGMPPVEKVLKMLVG